MTYSIIHKLLWITLITYHVSSAQGFQQPTAQQIIDQWFSIDSHFDINMDQQVTSTDEKITTYSLNFISDDQSPVNGILTVPHSHKKPISLAFLLHAMGTDQQLWWQDNKIHGHDMTKTLLDQGYAVLTLDARRHGQRQLDDLSAKDIIAKAHSDEPRLYTDMIIGSIRDYRLVMQWLRAQASFSEVDKTLIVGYSMGAQMALILASYETNIDQVIAMVPPYVKANISPVAPRLHVHNIKNAQVFILAAKQDPYSSIENTQLTFDHITSQNKSIQWFDSGHLLPSDYYLEVLSFIKQSSDKKVQP